jgi:hypothetical protein
MGTFSGTSLPPIVRVGNSADAVQALRRDTAVASLSVELVRSPRVVRSSAVAAPRVKLEFVAKRRAVRRRRRVR